MKEAATLKQKLNGILRLTSVLQVKVEYFSVRRRKKNITKQRPRICVTARTKEGWRSRHEFSDPTNYIMGVGNVLYCCNQIQKKLQPCFTQIKLMWVSLSVLLSSPDNIYN